MLHEATKGSAQLMVIFLGAISAVTFGNVTVKMPFSMDALMSWSYKSYKSVSHSISISSSI